MEEQLQWEQHKQKISRSSGSSDNQVFYRSHQIVSVLQHTKRRARAAVLAAILSTIEKKHRVDVSGANQRYYVIKVTVALNFQRE